MKISIVIPCLNEEAYIEKTLRHLQSLLGKVEIIVVDGGSTDRTRKIAAAHEEIILMVSEKGRAKQMNYGAGIATGEVLLFLHADTLLPVNFHQAVRDHFQNPKYIGGSFRLKFDKKHPLLKVYYWCSKLSWEFFTYGDHAIFIKKDVFQCIDGFQEIPFLEDVEIQKRLRKVGKFKKLNTAVMTSARRFEKTGTIWQLITDVLIVGFYKLGVSPARLKRFYKDLG